MSVTWQPFKPFRVPDDPINTLEMLIKYLSRGCNKLDYDIKYLTIVGWNTCPGVSYTTFQTEMRLHTGIQFVQGNRQSGFGNLSKMMTWDKGQQASFLGHYRLYTCSESEWQYELCLFTISWQSILNFLRYFSQSRSTWPIDPSIDIAIHKSIMRKTIHTRWCMPRLFHLVSVQVWYLSNELLDGLPWNLEHY